MERFKMPTTKELMDIAILFGVDEGKMVDRNKLADMMAMCEFLLDRLHEHGDHKIKSTKEIELEKEG